MVDFSGTSDFYRIKQAAVLLLTEDSKKNNATAADTPTH
jgi:hypothetical protein